MLDPFTSNRQDAATSSSSSPSPPAPLLPIIFCGPGSNLYPLCDPSSSSSSRESLPKAILPVANRPLIAYPLQQLVSAGFRRVLVVASSSQHRAIEVALKGLRLQVPHVGEGKTAGGSKETSKAGSSGTDDTTSNIVVVDGLSAAATSKTNVPPSASANTAIRVDLIPLGPYDVKGVIDVRDDQGQSSGGDSFEFRRVARPGTAELLRWLAHIGKLESDPLVLPVDFIAPSLPLSSFLLSYYSTCTPSSPTVTTLLYERGAGESVGREREKEAPPRMMVAYSHSSPATSTSPVPNSSAAEGLSTHSLLLLSELPSGSTLDVRLSLLEAFPRAHFNTALLDSHLYILRRDQIVPLLNARKDFTSLREHVVPFVAKAGWQSGLVEKVGWGKLLREEASTSRKIGSGDDLEEGLGDISIGDGEAGGLMQLAFQRSSLALPNTPAKSRVHRYDSIRAVTVVARLRDLSTANIPTTEPSSAASKPGKRTDPTSTAGNTKSGNGVPDTTFTERFFVRANTLPTYLESNRFLLRALSSTGQPLVTAGGGSKAKGSLPFPLPTLLLSSTSASLGPSTTLSSSSALPTTTMVKHEISGSAQLSPDTLIPLPTMAATAGPGADDDPRPLLTISDRASLKRSVLAPNVHISRNVKLSGSIVMEGAYIGEGAKLDNCLVGPGARVGEGCNLKDVDLGPGARVSGKREVKGEKIAKGEEEDGEEEDSGLESLEDEDR